MKKMLRLTDISYNLSFTQVFLLAITFRFFIKITTWRHLMLYSFVKLSHFNNWIVFCNNVLLRFEMFLRLMKLWCCLGSWELLSRGNMKPVQTLGLMGRIPSESYLNCGVLFVYITYIEEGERRCPNHPGVPWLEFVFPLFVNDAVMSVLAGSLFWDDKWGERAFLAGYLTSGWPRSLCHSTVGGPF